MSARKAPAGNSAPEGEPIKDDDIGGFTGITMGAGLTVQDVNSQRSDIQNGQEYKNKALDSDVYGGRKITYINKYDRFQQVEQINPRLGVGLIKLGLKLRGPEYKLFVDPAAGIRAEAQRSIIQDAEDFTAALDLQNLFTSAGRLLARDGSVPLLNSADPRFGSGEGITTLDFMPMSHTTFLPIDVKPLSGFQNEEQLWEYGTITGGVTQVIMNERIQAKREIHYLRNGRVTLMRLMHHGYQCRDIYNRNTIGLYGISLMELIDPQVKKLEDVNWGYSKAIGRYGFGRLHIDNELIKQMLMNKLITMKQAAKILAAEQRVMDGLEPNRDLLTIGKTVQAVPGGFENATGVIQFKESLEKDISYALLETEAGSNKGAGSTFASSNISDIDAVRVIESLRIQLKTGFEKIYTRHLELLGYKEEEAHAIRIELQPLNTHSVDLMALLDVAAMDPSAMTIGQALEIAGINVPPRKVADREEGESVDNVAVSPEQTPPAKMAASIVKRIPKDKLNRGEALTASKMGEWKFMYGSHILVKPREELAAAYLRNTGRNMEDDAVTFEEEQRRALEEKKDK